MSGDYLHQQDYSWLKQKIKEKFSPGHEGHKFHEELDHLLTDRLCLILMSDIIKSIATNCMLSKKKAII